MATGKVETAIEAVEKATIGTIKAEKEKERRKVKAQEIGLRSARVTTAERLDTSLGSARNPRMAKVEQTVSTAQPQQLWKQQQWQQQGQRLQEP